jgi:hypothetical protein
MPNKLLVFLSHARQAIPATPLREAPPWGSLFWDTCTRKGRCHEGSEGAGRCAFPSKMLYN